MIRLPRILKNFDFSIAGLSASGTCDTVTPPTLEIKTEDHRGGGMDMDVKLDMGMNALVMEASFAEYDPQILTTFGRRSGNSPQYVFRGHCEDEDGNTRLVTITARGRVNKLTPAEVGPGKKNTLSITIDLRFYRMDVDGAIVHLIDPINMERVIGGENQLAAMKASLS